MVESSFPVEVLRACERNERNGQYKVTDYNGKNDTKDRLENLLEFLEREIENQECIDMALQGFELSAEAEKIKKRKPRTDTKVPASANALLTSEKGKQVECIFCKSPHERKDCEFAQKMSLSERRECVKKENTCFICENAVIFQKIVELTLISYSVIKDTVCWYVRDSPQNMIARKVH